MGKIGGSSWLDVVKKAFRSPAKDRDKHEKKSSKRREDQEQQLEEKKRGKRRWTFQKHLFSETTIQHDEAEDITLFSNASANMVGGNLARTSAQEAIKSQQQCAITVAMATKMAAEAAVATAQAAAEIIRLATPSISVRQQPAAIVIQTAFRGYLARRALRALKGLVKLQALVRGHNVRKRAKITVQCIQALMRLQAQACDQRKRLSFEGCKASNGANCILESLARSKKVNSRNARYADDQLQKTEEAAWKPGTSLSQAFSQQVWKTRKAQISPNERLHKENAGLYECFDRTVKLTKEMRRSCSDEKEFVKNVEIDSARPCTYAAQKFPVIQRPSCGTASSPLQKMHNFSIPPPFPRSPARIKPLQEHSASPCCKRDSPAVQAPTGSNYSGTITMSANTIPALHPKYMAATESANARARSLSTPRQRTSTSTSTSTTPRTEKKRSVKKRLSFTAAGPYSNLDGSSPRWNRTSKNHRITDIDMCVEDEQRSYMSS